MSGDSLEETFRGLEKGEPNREHSSMRVNILFFFLTASQVTLWPWVPVILTTAGLSRSEAGNAIFIQILCSVLGVRLSLKAVEKTTSGAIRRLCLFSLSILCFFFGLSSLLITTSKEPFCFQENNGVHNIIQINKLTHHTLNKTLTHSEKVKEKYEDAYSTPQILFKEETINRFNYSHVSSTYPSFPKLKTEHDDEIEIPSLVNHTTESNVEFGNIADLRPPGNHTTSISHSVHINRNSVSKVAYHRQDFNIEDVQDDKESGSKTSEYIKFVNPNIKPTEKEIGSGATHSKGSSHFEPDIQIKNKNTLSNVKDFEKFEDDDLEVQVSNENYPINYFSTDFNQHTSGGYRSDHVNSLDNHKPRGYTQRYDSSRRKIVKDSPDFTEPLIYKDDNFDSSSYINNAGGQVYGLSPRKTTYLNQISQLQEDFQGYEQKNGYMDPIPQTAHVHRYAIPNRKKRSVELKSFQHSHIIDKVKNTTKNNVRSRQLNSKTEESNAYNRTSSVGWGIAALLMLAALIGGGIEATISKLWHCYVHGVPHDRGTVDVIEATITPTLRLIFLGNHRHWSLVTSALWIIIPTVTVGLSCQVEIYIHSPFKIFAMFYVIAGVMQGILLLLVPVPYGNLSVSRSKRPLSLYLDDEVIQEGLRRISFHGWIFTQGFLISLPSFYTLWLLEEMPATKSEVLVAQTVAVAAILTGEVVVYPAERWIIRKLNTQGVMIACGFLLVLQSLLVWGIRSLWFRSGSLMMVGYAVALIWTSVKSNALLLGTTIDQEHEAWISWGCWKFGLMVGAAVWAGLSDSEWASKSIEHLFPLASVIAGVSTAVVLLLTLFSRTKGRRRRRMYHTLDLHLISDEDESEESEILHEEDWLVKRARKEGLKL